MQSFLIFSSWTKEVRTVTQAAANARQPRYTPAMANCSLIWETFNGEILDQLMLFFVGYCYCVCVLGTLCNMVALWCVVGCPRTRPSIKVLLCGLFSSTLLMCLLVMPFMAHVGLTKVHCDGDISRTLLRVMIALYVTLTEMELIYITVLALLRAVAVWSSHRRRVTMFVAVALLVGTAVYSTVSSLVVLAPFWVELLNDHAILWLSVIYNSVHVLAPVVVTLACYLSMMFAIWRNKQRLVASQHVTIAAGQMEVMDQATRAMLAVFVSNLLFVLPHSVYHMLPKDFGIHAYTMVHCVFYTHLVVDPVAYLSCNLHHRRRVLYTLESCSRWAACRHLAPSSPHTVSTLPLHVTPQTSSDEPRKEHG